MKKITRTGKATAVVPQESIAFAANLVRETDYWMAHCLQVLRMYEETSTALLTNRKDCCELRLRVSELENQLDTLRSETVDKESFAASAAQADELEKKNIHMASMLQDVVLSMDGMARILQQEQSASDEYQRQNCEIRAQIQFLEEDNIHLNTRLMQAERETDLLKEQTCQLQKSNEQMLAEIKVLKEANRRLADMLADSVDSADALADILNSGQMSDSRTRIQLAYVTAQNKRYQNTIDRCKCKWYGKLGIFLFRILFPYNAGV